MSVRSMYTYIDKGLFTARNVDLKRQTKFKPRKCHQTQIKDREAFTNRTYTDFCSLELNSYVQMDTVKSYTVNRFFPHLVEIDVLKLYNTYKIYLPRGIFIWTNLLSYLTQPMN